MLDFWLGLPTFLQWWFLLWIPCVVYDIWFDPIISERYNWKVKIAWGILSIVLWPLSAVKTVIRLMTPSSDLVVLDEMITEDLDEYRAELRACKTCSGTGVCPWTSDKCLDCGDE